MPKTKLTIGQRTTIVILYNQTPPLSLTEIAEAVGCTKYQVRYWIQMFETRNITDHIAPGRTPYIHEAFIDDIMIETIANPYQSNDSLADDLGINPESVREIRHDLGFEFAKPFITPPLTLGHKSVRMSFAQNLLNNRIDLTRIVFTDESTIMIDCSRKKCWKVPGCPTENTTVTKGQSTVKRMVWGSIGLNWKSDLIYINGIMNSQVYINQLLNNDLKGQLDAHFNHNYLMQQDGATSHTSAYTMGWFRAMQFPILDGWPALSPDLSPIEHCWDHVKDHIKMSSITTLQELDIAIKKAWDDIPMNTINNLIMSFEARLKVCIEIKGQSLNGHWQRVHEIHHS